MHKCSRRANSSLRSRTHHFRVPSELYGSWVSCGPLNAAEENSIHLVQRLDLFSGDAGLSNLHQIKPGLRVDNGEDASEVAPAILSGKIFPGSVLDNGNACMARKLRLRLIMWREICCPSTCGHRIDPLIVCFAGLGFLPRASVRRLHWPARC